MDATQLRSQLSENIEQVDEPKPLFNTAAIEILHKRRAAHLSGESKSYTAAESIERIRQSKTH